MKRLAIIIVAALLVMAALSRLNEAAHRGMFGDNVRQLSQFFFKRSDLYDPLYRGKIARIAPEEAYAFTFRNRYAGKHQIKVLVTRKFEIKRSELYAPYLATSLVCVSDGQQVFRQSRNGVHSWFRSRNGQGFSLFEYAVPGDLPLNDRVTCTLQILEGRDLFWSEYGVYAIDVRKRSEE